MKIKQNFLFTTLIGSEIYYCQCWRQMLVCYWIIYQVYLLRQLFGIDTVILISNNPQMLRNRVLWSQQGSSKNIQDKIKMCDSYWKRLESVDKREGLSIGLNRYSWKTGCDSLIDNIYTLEQVRSSVCADYSLQYIKQTILYWKIYQVLLYSLIYKYALSLTLENKFIVQIFSYIHDY